MAKELKTLDLNALPDAVRAKYWDTMLIAKNDHDHQRTIPSCISIGKLLKKKNEQYVIGRAISTNAHHITGGMVNWYCVGSTYDGGSRYINFAIRKYKKYNVDGSYSYGNIDYVHIDGLANATHKVNNDIHKSMTTCTIICPDYGYEVYGLRVVNMIKDENKLLHLYLHIKGIPHITYGTSTRHWFERGKRCYRPNGRSRDFVKNIMEEVNRGNFTALSNYILSQKLIIYKLMKRHRHRGEKYGNTHNMRKTDEYIKAFRRLQTGWTQSTGSHAHNIGGYYKAILCYGLSRIKSDPVYFYVRPNKQDGGGNFIEWK